MLSVAIFAVFLIAFALLCVWLGRTPETKGKAGDSSGSQTFIGGQGDPGA